MLNIFGTGWSQGYDGPGWRWVVYLKGCNFRCSWCANPEGLWPEPQMLFYPQRGDRPEQACPYGAVEVEASGYRLARHMCSECVERPCVGLWRHPAFEWVGRRVQVEELVQEAAGYRSMFGRQGGVTFGGGEATLQADELCRAVEALHEQGIHTTVQTNAGAEGFKALVGLADLLICDVKSALEETHRKCTGADDRLVKENMQLAVRRQAGLLVRITLVNGVNDTDQEKAALLDRLRQWRVERGELRVEILRQHHAGEPKYAALDMDYPMRGAPVVSMETAEEWAEALRDSSIEARVVS